MRRERVIPGIHYPLAKVVIVGFTAEQGHSLAVCRENHPRALRSGIFPQSLARPTHAPLCQPGSKHPEDTLLLN